MNRYSNNSFPLEQDAAPTQSNLLVSGIAPMNNFSLMAPNTPWAAFGSCCVPTFARYMVDELHDDFRNLNLNGSQGDINLELEQLEYRYAQVTASLPIDYSWPDLLHPIFSSFSPKERVLKLRHTIRNLSFLKLLITKHGAAATQSECSLSPTMGYHFGHPFNSNSNASNSESANPSFLPSLPSSPRDYAQAGPSSGVPPEPRSNTVHNHGPLHLLHPASQATVLRQGTFPDPKIRICNTQVPKGGEDQQPQENHRRRPHTRSRTHGPSPNFCPLPSCSRNQCIPQKAFRRTDNLRAHLKTVHSLSITDGVWVPKWIAGNRDLLNEAEDRARARLSLTNSPNAYI